MIRYGLTLSSEEHSPRTLVDLAGRAEVAGFDFVGISDHFHPWISEQGHSPFVWSVLGAIAERTEHLHVGVGVSCPIVRIHPAVMAHAVATTACLLEDRLTWGVGTGEALNEHITGLRWPPAPCRLSMLEEAVDIVRQLLTGESVTHYGRFYTVEDARIFDLPRSSPPIVVSAFGPDAARSAARIGDGLWSTGIDEDTISTYRSAHGNGQIWTQLTLCWDADREVAVDRVHSQWPNTGLTGQLAQDLRTVEHFEQAVEMVTREAISESVPCGPDLTPVVQAAEAAVAAGATHIYFHQVGDPRDGFLDVWESELRPELPV